MKINDHLWPIKNNTYVNMRKWSFIVIFLGYNFSLKCIYKAKIRNSQPEIAIYIYIKHLMSKWKKSSEGEDTI